MKPAVKAAYRAALEQARAATTPEAAFAALERAHILGQRDLFAHFETHVLMLQWAVAQKDGREIRGQVLRLLAVLPGFLTGWVPVGNPGGSNISPLKPFALPPDLSTVLGKIDLKVDIALRIGVVGVALAIWALASSAMSQG